MKLTEKQERFCQEFVVDLNGTQAAIRAGYSPKTANRIASQLLSKLDIQERIAELQKEVAKEVKFSAVDAYREMVRHLTYDVKDFFRLEEKPIVAGGEVIGSRQEVVLVDYDKLDGTLIQEICQTANGIRIKLPCRQKALEMIGRKNGIFIDKKELTGKDGFPIIINPPIKNS